MEEVVENMLDEVMSRKEGGGGGGGVKDSMDVTSKDYEIGRLSEEENLWIDKGRTRYLLRSAVVIYAFCYHNSMLQLFYEQSV